MAAAVVLAVPGTAEAAVNLPPRQPLVADLWTGTAPCSTGASRPHVSAPPVLGAVLNDPEEDDRPGEGNRVKGHFEVWWTDTNGVEQRRTHTTLRTLSGTRQTWEVPDDVPADTVVSWRVRADDGTAVSDWSDGGEGSVCQFVRDDTSPLAPVVTSPDYPDRQYRDGVGVYAGFTLDSPSDDVVAYRYHFLGQTESTASPAEPGGPVTIRHLPLRPGPDVLEVRAVDRSGRPSATTRYDIAVLSGRGPVGHWPLADAPGSATGAAESGPAARAGSGVVFGAAAPKGSSVASAATLDGSDHAFLSPGAPVVGPEGTFAVSAWARPAGTARAMSLLSQDTGDGARFALGLRSEGDGSVWTFATGGAQVSGGVPETGEWAHLLALYDAETGRARLYVNGQEVGDAGTVSPPSGAAGAFQIGRVRHGDGYHDHWHGEVAGVRAHDRVVVPAEVAELAQRKPSLLGRWSLEKSVDGASPGRGPGQNGAQPLVLGPGATIHRGPDNCIPGLEPDCPDVPYALVGAGHLQLDGATGYAATDTAVVDTRDSFSIGVVVRLADAVPNRPMTVLSQAGRHTDVFRVRYDPSAGAWQLVVSQRDEAGAPETVVSHVAGAGTGGDQGRRLAVVYDDATDRITLYLDGHAAPGATASVPGGLPGSGALQVGRAKAGEGWGEYLGGDVDEVQAYAGALRARDVLALGSGYDPCLC